MTTYTANEIPADFKSTLPPRKRAKTQEEKEQRRIERILRNRKAAHQSREKKRLHLMYLEKKCALLERIVARVDLTEVSEESDDGELRRAVRDYEAFVHAGRSSDSGGSSIPSATSAMTTPGAKSPSMSGTTPGSPCTTVLGAEGAGFEQRETQLENGTGFGKADAESYSYIGGAAYVPSFAVYDEADPRGLAGAKSGTNESWDLLLTHSNSYQLENNVSEPLQMADSSLELDHWRNPAEIALWERSE
ncbi:HDL529Wp [Eremothecium sinecaudum]|uniref:HDL529Wp n=1 Tax=Eremothecium sinecaudum TaxID=45286 RepID=A0A0X8HRP7_9SACH|nr:HDL529Wp [Eremothecium sinecaudum]AMD20215.1 HDL529Wp [Eremothecium sinecaudum]